MLVDDKLYGFIVVDGTSIICAKVSNNNYQILYKTEVDLPKKHNKGG
jgi:peptide chain release factor subunit 1